MPPMPAAGVQPPWERWPQIPGGHRLNEHSLSLIVQTAADAFGVTPADIRSGRRDPRIAVARHAAIWLARRMTRLSLPAIGLAFGSRHHTTVIYAVWRNAQRMAKDRAHADRVLALEAALAAADADEEDDRHAG